MIENDTFAWSKVASVIQLRKLDWHKKKINKRFRFGLPELNVSKLLEYGELSCSSNFMHLYVYASAVF